jgi:ssDNA thymidine ADP-ribosyltransferase, DarT
MANYQRLNAENAYIWRIVHRQNLPWLLDHGLVCANSQALDPGFVAIGNADLISRRTHRVVPIAPGGTLNDYVPFYFTPFSPMMYNIYTGRTVRQQRNEDICMLVSTLPVLRQLAIPFVFTDRHAYTQLARFFSDLADLDKIDWALLQARNFKRNPDDPEQIERYQAEALVHRHLPVTGLTAIVCYTEQVKTELEQMVAARHLNVTVQSLPHWYF